MADRKAVVKNADMSEDMQQDAIDISTQALEKFNIEKDIAAFIKKEFDKKYNPTWHCIVGKRFNLTLRRQELRLVHHPRNKALHLFLLGPGSHPALQVWLSSLYFLNPLICNNKIAF